MSDPDQSVAIDAPAKINLTLDITGRRADGYHLLRSVMQTVDLCDTVTVIPGGEGISLVLSDPSLPADERNTAWKAAVLFFAAIGQPADVSILIEKRIPQQAGLAGGSADAAAVLRGLNEAFDRPLSSEELQALGVQVGADVPFCLTGGTALAQGIGEQLTPLPELLPVWIAIAKPPVGVSTGAAYAAVDRQPIVLHAQDEAALLEGLQQGDGAAVGAHLFNVFEQALALPEVGQLHQIAARHNPLGCCMSGSGSAVYALFAQEQQACACAEEWEPLAETFVCRPISPLA